MDERVTTVLEVQLIFSLENTETDCKITDNGPEGSLLGFKDKLGAGLEDFSKVFQVLEILRPGMRIMG